MRRHTLSLALCMLTLASPACSGPETAGITPTQASNGPKVVWKVLAKPLAEIPLPNDAATRLDPHSPTGRRLNISEVATTEFERKMRRKFNRLDGFGTYGPIMVRFDRPLNLKDLWARHNGGPWPDGGPYPDDFRDDAVFVFNVDPRCERFGEEIALDVGRGRFPVIVDKRSQWRPDEQAPQGRRLDEGGNILFEYDPLGLSNNHLFEERDEDRNGDGALAPAEDTDFDGHLDAPNFMDPTACDGLEPQSLEHDRCVADQLLTFYDRQDDTLILRPVWPLEQRCRHAVVLTQRLKGVDGAAVTSPFPGVNPASQTQALRPIYDFLPRYGLDITEVAFAWTFTTGSMTTDLEALREGLHGRGPFARLAAEFPVSDVAFIPTGDPGAAGGVIDHGPCVGLTMTTIWSLVIGEWKPNMCALSADFAAVAGAFWGTFEAPDLMVDTDGIATDAYPANDNESWNLNSETGEATYGRTKIPFWCALPYAHDTSCSPGNPEGQPFCRPFPVVLFNHGYTGSRWGQQDFMGRFASMGYAACAMDAYGHGKNRLIAEGDSGLYDLLLAGFDTAGMRDMLLVGRDRDLNNDGLPDPGGDFWTADIFHTRDMIRQTALEYSQFVRILRSFGTEPGLGDVDGDGLTDLGGPENVVSMWGISLGGIVAGVVKGSEPGFDAVSPNAGGAGLTDIATRSVQAGVPEAALLPIIGPFILGNLPSDKHDNPTDGPLRLRFLVNDVGENRRLTLGEVDGVAPGDRVVLENLDNGASSWAVVSERGTFRIAVAADALSAMERRPLLGLTDDDTEPVVFPDTAALGDRIRLTIHEGRSDAIRVVVDRFLQDVTFQGTVYPSETPLVALQEGLGYRRNSPNFRRFLGIAQHALDPADPAIWSAHAARQGHPTRALVMPTAGDMQVPVNTGIAEARIVGTFGSWFRDLSLPAEYGWRELFMPRVGFAQSPDNALIGRYVVEGVERLRRFETSHPELAHPAVLYDIDNLSDATAAFSCLKGDEAGDWSNYNCPDEIQGTAATFTVPATPSNQALRANKQRGDGRFDACRIPLLRPTGQHGIYNAQPFRAFDHDAWTVNFTARFLGTRGTRVDHVEGCDCSATEMARYELRGTPQTPALQNRPCEPTDLKLCTPECAEAWGIRSPTEVLSCGNAP